MKLEDIGFYTLSDHRACQTCPSSPMWRCEIIITDACNFKCPYCRGLKGDRRGTMSKDEILKTVFIWHKDHLKNVRFSGGEPTIHPALLDVVRETKSMGGVEHIAVSSNGSAKHGYYDQLLSAGVNDFSISLDACCAAYGDEMAGKEGVWDHVVETIRFLAARTYVTVGVVLNETNVDSLVDTVCFAHDLGVADIRIISAAQYNQALQAVKGIPQNVLDAHPILRYRVGNYMKGRNVRGIREHDSHTCHLVQDDSVVVDSKHYPCVIYMREGGDAIGPVGDNMREERIRWMRETDISKEPICSKNCLDICIDYNNAVSRRQCRKD